MIVSKRYVVRYVEKTPYLYVNSVINQDLELEGGDLVAIGHVPVQTYIDENYS